MTDLLIYLFKAAVINAIILGFYYFTLKKTNRFSFMRVTLLSAMILPLLLPLIPISGTTSKVLTGNTTTLAIELPVAVIQQGYNEWLSAFPPPQEFIYYLIAFMFLIGMIFSIISIFRKKVRSVKYATQFGDILIEKSVRSPFSFFEWVFFSRPDLEHPKFDMLLKHEFYHVKEKHSLDRIISGIFRSVLWFSPFVHITAKRLIEVHEYQADANVLQSHVEPSEYSDLVLSFYLNNLSTNDVSNNFSFHIKNRIAMINNLNVGRLRIGRIVFGLSFSLLAMLATSALQSSTPIIDSRSETPDLNYTTGDTVPPYPTIEYKWLKKQRNNDEIKGLSGKVILSIQIDEMGNASNYAIYQSAGNKLDDYAMQLVREFKGWNPARVNNRSVSYRILYPITFPSLDEVELQEHNDENLLVSDPDTIKKSLSKQEEKRLEKEQVKIAAKQEKVQKEQAKIEAEQSQIQAEQAKIEIEQKKVAEEQAKVEKIHAEIEKEHAKIQEEQIAKEKEFRQREEEFKEKEKEYKQKENEYLEKQKEPQSHEMPDSPAKYPGGDQARVTFISSNIVYPEDARKQGKQGTVYVQFIINEEGKVTNAKVLKSVFPSLDKAALDVVNKMPAWKPAMKDDKPVKYEMTMPIKFELSKDKVGTVSKDKSAADVITTPNSQPQKKEGSEIYTVVEESPSYPGGDDARIAYMVSKINYTSEAKKQGIEGTVYVTFVVEPDGSVTNAKILRGIGGGLDEIALAAVKGMPKWEPGKVKGKPVPVQFNMPIKFKLPKEKSEE